MSASAVSRRVVLGRLVAAAAGAGGGAALAACGTVTAPQVVKETVIVQEVVKETVVVEREVTAQAQVEVVQLSLFNAPLVLGDSTVIQEKAIPTFMELNPDIEVTVTEVPAAEYFNKLHAMAAAGDLPDVYGDFINYIWDHAHRKMNLNLQPYVDTEINVDDYFFEIELEGARYPSLETGDLYAFPTRWVGTLLYYNKGLFDAAGIAYPDDTWTYDTLLERAQQLTKTEGSGTPTWGLDCTWYWWPDSLIAANGGAVISPDYKKCMLDEPVAIEAMQWLVDCIHTHGVIPSPATAQGFGEGTFASQVVAMVLEGSWYCHTWQGTEFEWDISYIPTGKAKRVMYDGPDLIAINRVTKQREASWRLVKYWVGEDFQSAYENNIHGSVPILKSAAYSEAYLQREGSPGNLKVLLDMAPVCEADYGPSQAEWRYQAMKNELDLALLGERSVEESMQAACAAIDDVLSKVPWPV